jgi:dipeptidase
LIADTSCAYVLETSGKRWAAKRAESRCRISNRLSIRSEHTLRGGVEAGFDLAKKLTEPVYTFFSGSKQRQSSSYQAISGDNMRAEDMFRILRTHYKKDGNRVFTKGSVKSVCMHAGGIVGDHTTGSLVAELRKNAPSTLWVTAASTPCLSVYKPCFFGVDSGAPVFENEEEAKSYWLTREKLHRAALAGLVDVKAFRKERDIFEKFWVQKERVLFEVPPKTEELLKFARSASAAERELIESFLPETEITMPGKSRFARYWQKKNEKLFTAEVIPPEEK